MFNNLNQMTDERNVWLFDVMYFLVEKYQYQPIQVANSSSDLWLLNKEAADYPMIRLTLDRTNKSHLEQANIIQQAEIMGSLINLKSKILNIHFGDEEQPLIQEEAFLQTVINDQYTSSILQEAFPGIEDAIKPVLDPVADLRNRRQQLQYLNPQETKKKGFFPKAKLSGANIIGVISLIVYLINSFLKFRYGRSQGLVMSGALYKTFIYGAHEWWRIFTAAFVHADFFHLFMNMIVLMQTGLLVERVFTRKRFFIIFLVSATTSSLFALVMNGANTITMGASGGIYGLFGAVLVYLISSKLIMIPMVRRQVTSVFMANLFLSFLPGISLYGHLGGFIGGVLVSLAFVESARFQEVKKHAIAAVILLMVGLVGIGVFKDNKVYDVNKSLDYAVVSSVRDLGLEGYGNYLMKKLNSYYGRLGL